MPYLGRAPTGTGSVTEIDGDLKITGQLTANDTLFKMIMDTAANLGDNFLIEDGGTDGSGTNAGDDICLEKDMQSVGATEIISISGVTGATASGWEFVSYQNLDAASTVDFNGFEAGYDYQIVGYALDPSADHFCRVRYSNDNGETFEGATYYNGTIGSYANGVAHAQYMNAAYATLSDASMGGATAGEEETIELTIFNPMDSSNHTWTAFRFMGFQVAGHVNNFLGMIQRRVDESVNGIQFYPSAGNFATGKVYLYRRLNA